jgi:hypothetical protein
MKKPRLFLPLLALCAALAGETAAAEGRNLTPQGVLADLILLRPLGLAMTVAGTGLFLGTSPFAGLAAAAPPHDALQRSGEALVIAPAAFTFWRPLGEFSYRPNGAYPDQ